MCLVEASTPSGQVQQQEVATLLVIMKQMRGCIQAGWIQEALQILDKLVMQESSSAAFHAKGSTAE